MVDLCSGPHLLQLAQGVNGGEGGGGIGLMVACTHLSSTSYPKV